MKNGFYFFHTNDYLSFCSFFFGGGCACACVCVCVSVSVSVSVCVCVCITQHNQVYYTAMKQLHNT